MKKFIYLFLFITFLNYQSVAQWVKLPGPTGGMPSCLEEVGSEIWVGYLSGIYISNDEGVTWTKKSNHPFATFEIKAIGDTILILYAELTATSNHLKFKSSFDGGVTWNLPVIISTNISNGGVKDLILTDFSLLIQEGGNVFVSFDWGVTWSAWNYPGLFASIAAHSDKFLICNSYGPPYTTYISYDGGSTFVFFDTLYASGVALIIDSTFYFLRGWYDSTNTYHSFIAKTEDFGQSWDTLALNLLNSGTELTFFNKTLYFFHWPYPNLPVIYESPDSGITWFISSIPTDLIWTDIDNVFEKTNGDLLIRSGTLGLFNYNPNSNTYSNAEDGIAAREIRFLKENNSKLFAKGDYKFFMSDDGGLTWNQPPSFVNPGSNFLFKGDTIIGTTLPINYKSNMAYSYDNGVTWDSIAYGPNSHWKHPWAINVLNNKLFISNYSYSYTAYSNDWGITWDSISTYEDSLCTSSGQQGDQLITCTGNIFMQDRFHRKISKFDPISQTWKKSLCTNANNSAGPSLYSLGNKLAYSHSNYFAVSDDTGVTWYTPAYAGLPLNVPRSLFAIDSVWYCTNSRNVYYSFDYGENWQQYPTSNDFAPGYHGEGVITSLNNILYVGGYGIWKSTGTQNLISGNVYFDNNNNGIKDINEQGINNVLLSTTPNSTFINTNTSGNYSFITAAIGDTLQPSLPTSYASFSPNYYLTTGTASNIDFGIYFYPNILDLSVDITHRGVFRPGFSTCIDIKVNNYGSLSVPGSLEIDLDSNLIFETSTLTPSSVIGNTYTFAINSLPILGSQTITIKVLTPSIIPISTPIQCSALINPVIGDTVPSNNFSQFNSLVVGSYDPNDKSSLHHPYFTPIQLQNSDEMIYTIRFQNEGTYQADNVYIIDTLNNNFDLSSFRVISYSHPMHYNLFGDGIVTFYFDNINLPAAIFDEPNSHGFVKFAVKCKNSVGIGSLLNNTAYIYFDFNAPIVTNTISTIVDFPPVSVEDYHPNSDIKIYPNPTTGHLTIEFPAQNAKGALNIFDILGNMLITDNIENDTKIILDISSLSSGIYFCRISWGNEMVNAKLIKQ